MRLAGRSSRWLAFACALALVGGAVGCKKGGDAGGAVAGGATVGGATPGGAAPSIAAGPPPLLGFAASTPILTGVVALESLPKDALFVVAAESVLGLSDRLGRPQLLEQIKDIYAKAATEVSLHMGFDALDPKQLPELGVDGTKPFGFAWLDVEKESFTVFFTLLDGTKLLAKLDAIGQKEGVVFTKEKVGDATIAYVPKDSEVCIVLRGTTGFVVVSDEGDEAGLAEARRIAGVAPADSIAKDPGFLAALGKLGFGKDAAAYVNVPALLALAEKEMTGQGGRATQFQRDEIARLKAAGGDPETIASLEASLKAEEEWAVRRQKEAAAEMALLRSVLGKPAGIALGLEVGARALHLKGYIPTDAAAPLGKLLRNGTATPLLAKTLGEKPLLAFGATLDPKALVDLVRTFAGEEWEEARKEIREEFQIDYEQDVLALLSGDAAFALTGVMPLEAEQDLEFARGLGGAWVQGVNDAAKAAALLDRIAALPMAAPFFKKDAETGGYEVVVPMWKSVWLAVAGNAMVLTTDKTLVGRVKDGTAGGGLAKVAVPGLAELAERPGAAAWGLMEMRVSLFPFLMLSARLDFDPPTPADTNPDVPFSKEYQAKKSELDKVTAELAAAKKAKEAFETEVATTLADTLGFTAARFEVVPDGLVMFGGQYFGAESVPALTTAIGKLVAKGVAMDEQSTKRWQLYDTKYKLEEELRRTRELDVERFRSGGAAPTP